MLTPDDNLTWRLLRIGEMFVDPSHFQRLFENVCWAFHRRNMQTPARKYKTAFSARSFRLTQTRTTKIAVGLLHCVETARLTNPRK